MNLIDIYPQPLQNRPPVVFKLTENRQQRRRMIAEARVAHSELMEITVYRQSYTLGRLLSERQLSRDEVLQIFKAAEAGATAGRSNRTLAGRIKDKGSTVIANARDMINGAKKWVRERPTYQAVDTEYNKAMTALGKLAANNPGEANKLTQAIYRYRAAAKEYPRATGLAKWAILALTGLATGGMGAAAAIAAIDSAVRDQDLVDIASSGLQGAAAAAAAQGISSLLSGSAAPAGSDAYTGSVPDAQDFGSDAAIGGATPGSDAVIGGATTGTDPYSLASPPEITMPYTVKAGDTLSDLALKNDMSVSDLMNANPDITNPDVLRAGQTINIPSSTGAATYAGGVGTGADTAAKVAGGQYTPNPVQASGAEQLSGPGSNYEPPAAATGVQSQPAPATPITAAGQVSMVDNIGVPDDQGLIPARLQLPDGSFTDVTLAPQGGMQPRIPPGTESIKTYLPDQAQPVTAYKIGNGWYVKNYAPAVQESMDWAKGVKVKTLRADQLIEQKLTVLHWALNESTGRDMGRSVILTPRATRVVFENVGRYHRALVEYTGAPTPEYEHPTAAYGPDTPYGMKKGWFGRALDTTRRVAGKVGDWAGNVGHNVITKVTADKLNSAWNRQKGGKDSDALYAFLLKQGVPQAVVSDIYQRMGIPVSPQPRRYAPLVYGNKVRAQGDLPEPAVAAPATATPAAAASSAPAAPAAAPATPAAAAATVYPGEDPNGPNYVGRREVERRQKARAAQAGVKNLNPYSKATYKFTNPAKPAQAAKEYPGVVGTMSGMRKAAPAAPKPKQAELDADRERLATGANESLGNLRPKLGSKRDKGKSIRKWRRARGLDETSMAEEIVGKPRYSAPHQSGRGFYSAAEYMVRTNHQLGSHAYTAVTQVDGDNDRYYFIYQKGNKEPVFYATDMGEFEVRTDKLGNRISNAIMTAHREATDHDLEKYMSGDDEQGVAEGRPNVQRHTGDKTVRVVRRGGKPIGEIGIDAEASPGQGQYYVKLYDGSVDLSGYDTAQEALEELRSALAEDQDHAFKRGDRVYVRNQIGSDRVIRVVGDQVYLEKMGRAPMRDVSRVNPGLGQQIRTAGVDVARGLRDFVTGKD